MELTDALSKILPLLDPKAAKLVLQQTGDRDPEELLFLEDVATITKASISTVRWWVQEATLPSVKVGRRRMVRRRDLDAFIGGKP